MEFKHTIINENTFKAIWNIIKDKYDVKDWETCSESKLDRAERLELKMHSAFTMIKDMTLDMVKNCNDIKVNSYDQAIQILADDIIDNSSGSACEGSEGEKGYSQWSDDVKEMYWDGLRGDVESRMAK
tara:strand:+ start:9406 stop:9789 length:384 start_codon:yes stop_codon:yes gene_type:complete